MNCIAKRSASRLAVCVLCLSSLSSLSACGNRLGEQEGVTVRGTVAYLGTGAEQLESPLLEVSLFSTFPPSGLPHAQTSIPDPDFAAGPVAFALNYVRPYDYYLVASLVDAQNPDDRGSIAGGFPDFCALDEARGGLAIPLMAEQSIEVELFDGSGTQDPCKAAAGDDAPAEPGEDESCETEGPGEAFAGFGDECIPDENSGSPDCPDSAPFCAAQPGSPVGTCTIQGCLEDPSVCPPTWGCLDLSAFDPTLPAICVES